MDNKFIHYLNNTYVLRDLSLCKYQHANKNFLLLIILEYYQALFQIVNLSFIFQHLPLGDSCINLGGEVSSAPNIMTITVYVLAGILALVVIILIVIGVLFYNIRRKFKILTKPNQDLLENEAVTSPYCKSVFRHYVQIVHQ